ARHPAPAQCGAAGGDYHPPPYLWPCGPARTASACYAHSQVVPVGGQSWLSPAPPPARDALAAIQRPLAPDQEACGELPEFLRADRQTPCRMSATGEDGCSRRSRGMNGPFGRGCDDEPAHENLDRVRWVERRRRGAARPPASGITRDG